MRDNICYWNWKASVVLNFSNVKCEKEKKKREKTVGADEDVDDEKSVGNA